MGNNEVIINYDEGQLRLIKEEAENLDMSVGDYIKQMSLSHVFLGTCNDDLARTVIYSNKIQRVASTMLDCVEEAKFALDQYVRDNRGEKKCKKK